MMSSLTVEKDYDILTRIKFLRKEMIRVGMQEGINSEKTINISRKLDMYIVKYQKNNL